MALLAAVWGCSFLFIKVADESLAPLQVAFGRILCGAAALVVVLTATRRRLPHRGTAGHLAVVAFFMNALPFSLFAYGETHVSAVLAGIWNATTALFTLPVAALVVPGEHATRGRLAGVVVGFAGVLVVLGVWTSGLRGSSLLGSLLCLAAALSYAIGTSYTRRFVSGRGEDALSLATGQLLAASLEMAVLVPLATAAPAALPARVVLSVVLLGVFGTGLAFVLMHSIVRDAGAATASMVTYVVPFFSTVAGVAFLHEHLQWYEPVGGIVILCGAALSQGRLLPASVRGRLRRRAATAGT
jgi:drug/metabolite transporter (DMT)-like permease